MPSLWEDCLYICCCLDNDYLKEYDEDNNERQKLYFKESEQIKEKEEKEQKDIPKTKTKIKWIMGDDE